MATDEPPRRRRRVRGPEPAPAPEAVTSPVYDEPALPAPALAPIPLIPPADGETSANERGLRGLVGPGSSQVSPAAALRARDAARPRDEDLARAENELTIIRRNWSPRD